MTSPFTQWPGAEIWEPVLSLSHPSLPPTIPCTHPVTHHVLSSLPSSLSCGCLLLFSPATLPSFWYPASLAWAIEVSSYLPPPPALLQSIVYCLNDLTCTLCQFPASNLSVILHHLQQCLSNVFKQWIFSSNEIFTRSINKQEASLIGEELSPTH